MIEMRDFFAENEVFQQRRATRGDAERVLIVADRDALVGSHRRVLGPRSLMQFARSAQKAFSRKARRRRLRIVSTLFRRHIDLHQLRGKAVANR